MTYCVGSRYLIDNALVPRLREANLHLVWNIFSYDHNILPNCTFWNNFIVWNWKTNQFDSVIFFFHLLNKFNVLTRNLMTSSTPSFYISGFRILEVLSSWQIWGVEPYFGHYARNYKPGSGSSSDVGQANILSHSVDAGLPGLLHPWALSPFLPLQI